MPPIRVGIIGLAAVSAESLLHSWAVKVHLPGMLSMSDQFELVAVCNSSAESASAAIRFHRLPTTVRAYGTPEDLAKDPDVDLVVISVQVHHHYKLAKPVIEAGKDVFVEAPLAASLVEARTLASLAREKGVRTMVGTQGRGSAVVREAQRLIQSGEIGEVVSSTISGSLGRFPRSPFPYEARWWLDLEEPGNSLLITFMHLLDTHRMLLGEFTDYHARIERKEKAPVELLDSAGVVIAETKSTTPDHLMLLGKLQSGVLSSIALRPVSKRSAWTTSDLSDVDCMSWVIAGTLGEVEIKAPDVLWQGSGNALKLFLRKDQTKTEIQCPHEHAQLPLIAQNTAGLYSAFARGNNKHFADFDDAARLIEFMEELRVEARRGLRDT